ncbi:mutator type transposase [Tanacetum coccineum]
MDRRECSCRKWELDGIPCKHVVDAIYMFENEIGVIQGARQAAGARNISSQAAGSSQHSQSRQDAGAKNASSQAAGSSQTSTTPSQASQRPSQHSA